MRAHDPLWRPDGQVAVRSVASGRGSVAKPVAHARFCDDHIAQGLRRIGGRQLAAELAHEDVERAEPPKYYWVQIHGKLEGKPTYLEVHMWDRFDGSRQEGKHS